jgi:hypothetical protein
MKTKWDDIEEVKKESFQWPVWLQTSLYIFLLTGTLAHCAVFVWVLHNVH